MHEKVTRTLSVVVSACPSMWRTVGSRQDDLGLYRQDSFALRCNLLKVSSGFQVHLSKGLRVILASHPCPLEPQLPYLAAVGSLCAALLLVLSLQLAHLFFFLSGPGGLCIVAATRWKAT